MRAPTLKDRVKTMRLMMITFGAPMTPDNLTRLAGKYERTYRRARASRRPPPRQHLAGMLQTARAAYRLAREVAA